MRRGAEEARGRRVAGGGNPGMSRCLIPYASKGKKPHGRRLPSEPSRGMTRRRWFGELLDRRDVRTLRGRLTSYLADPSGSGSHVRSGESRSTTRDRSS